MLYEIGVRCTFSGKVYVEADGRIEAEEKAEAILKSDNPQILKDDNSIDGDIRYSKLADRTAGLRMETIEDAIALQNLKHAASVLEKRLF